MDDRHPSAGETAGGIPMGQEGQIQHLNQRLTKAESQIDFLVDIINALLDRMYGPDDDRKPRIIREVVERYDI